MEEYIIHINEEGVEVRLGVLKDALATLNEEGNDSDEIILNTVVSLIRNKSRVIIPVEVSDELKMCMVDDADEGDNNTIELSDEDALKLKSLELDSGETAYVVFTDTDEADAGDEKTCTVTEAIDEYFEKAIMNPDISGVMINPWSDSCFLPIGYIKYAFEQSLTDQSMSSKEAELYREITENDEDFKTLLHENDGRLEDAIEFATRFHRGQYRKGTVTPYILHPLEVMQILAGMYVDTNLMIAGVLHDTIEDTEATVRDIYDAFGADVATLVSEHSEDKNRVWYLRKLGAIKALGGDSFRHKLLVAADKLSNLRSMYRDYQLIGDELWLRFNAPKHMQSWYYSEMIDGLNELREFNETSDVFWEINGLYKELFVEYAIDDVNERIYQISAHGQAFVYERVDPRWRPADEISPHIRTVERAEAERIEENWVSQAWESFTDETAKRTLLS